MARPSRLPESLAQRGTAALICLLMGLCPVFWPQAGACRASDQEVPRVQPFNTKPAAGRLLVADKKLQDPTFRHSVVLLLDHGDQGSTGLIINRPTALPLSNLSERFLREGDVDILYYGGPVQPMSFSMLIASEQQENDGKRVLGNIFHVFGAHSIMASIAYLDPTDSARIYSGYAGWAPGQLEFEIELGGWHVLPGESAHVFSEQPGRLWDELNRLAEGQWL